MYQISFIHLLIILSVTGLCLTELVDQCNDFCTKQIVTVEDDFDLVCNKTCKLIECKIGCQKWFTFSNLLTCPQICESKKTGEPIESIYCNIGCNQALKLYVHKIRFSLGIPSAPYLVGDSLRNDSLILQWKTSTLNFNISYLVQFKYSQLNSEWIYYRPTSPTKNGQLTITNLMPFTVYKFRVASFLLDNFKSNQNSKEFDELVKLGFMRKNLTTILPSRQHSNNRMNSPTINENSIDQTLTSLDDIEPIFSEESVEIRTLPYGPPSLAPKIENCIARSSTKLLIIYRSPEFINGELISYSLNANLVNDNALQTNLPETAEHQVIRDIKVEDSEPKSKSMNYILSNLLPNSLYNISLSLVNKEGTGPASSIQCRTLNSDGQTNYKQMFFNSNKRNQQIDIKQIEPKLILATKKFILNKKSTNYADSLEILFRLEDFHIGENFTSLAVHIGRGELFTADTLGFLRKIDLNGKFRKILSFNSQNGYGNLFTVDTPNYTRLVASNLLQIKISSLTVDYLNDKLYFVRRTILNSPRNFKINKPDQRFSTYSGYNELIEILRSNLDGTDLQVVLRFDYGELPVKLKVDPYNGFLFWSSINNYHNHAQLSRLMIDPDEQSTPENDRLIEKFLSNQDFKNLPKLSTSIFRIDLNLLNANHTLSSSNAKKIVQLINDPYSLQFTINPSELKIYYLKQTGQSSSTIFSINLDGSEPTDIRQSNVENSHFKINLRNLALFNRTFFWTLANETYSESYNNEENKFYHNMIYMDNKIGDLVGMELMHPKMQQVPIPLNTINDLQALFLNTDVKIKWKAPEILPETGLGAYRRWTYELCIMEMSSNYTNISSNELSILNEEKFLKKRICFDIKDQFCNLGQLKMNTVHLIKVRAVSSAGPGPWSSIFTGRTLVENSGDLESNEFKRIEYMSPNLIFATEDSLIRSNLIGDNAETILQSNSIGKHFIKDIAWYKDEIFVSIGNSSIYHLKRNKWNLLNKVNGANLIAIDWLTPKLYLSNEIQQTISRCNLDGSQLETLPLFSNVKQLVLDSTTALMYWSTGHSIEVATFNGIHKQKYYQVGLFSDKQISGLTLDYVTKKIYFYVQTFKSSAFYSGNLLNSNQVVTGSFDIQLKLISTLPPKSFDQGPFNKYSQKIFWLNDKHQIVITDQLGLNPSTITSFKNIHNLQLVHPSLQPIPVGFNDEQQMVVQPDSINKKIDINGSSTNFTISWQEVKNVAYGQVFYELILENRERIIELHLNQTSYSYPEQTNSDQIVLPVYRISIRAYTYWNYSKRTVIVLKFNNPSEFESKEITPQQSKIFYLEPPRRPTLLKINKINRDLYEIIWTSSNVNHLKYLNNENDEQYKAKKQDDDFITYGVFKKSISSDKWQLVYNGSETNTKIKFEANELTETNLIKLIAFNRFGESEPVNYDLNPNLDDLKDNSIKTMILYVVLGSFVTLGIVVVLLYFLLKKISEQSLEKKQLQFDDKKEVVVLSDYPKSFKKQNINDNQLYQRSEFRDLSFLKDIKEIAPSEVNYRKAIGEGAFATVYEGYAKFDKILEKVAVKISKNKSHEEAFLKEARLMSSLKHEHIVEFKGICFRDNSLLLLLEFMNKGDLCNYLKTNRPRGALPSELNVNDLIEICIQVAHGCVYLESQNYIHRDLSARNCLVHVEKDKRFVKISDFGLTKDIYRSINYVAGKDALLPIRWMAIESLNEAKFTTSSDVWSFAVLIWEVFTLGDRPYDGVDNSCILDLLKNGRRLERPKICPNDLYELMLKCWIQDPNERPSFHQCHNRLVQIRDHFKETITSVHNENYTWSLGNEMSDTSQATQSTALCPSYAYNGGRQADIVDTRSMSLICPDDMNKQFFSNFSNFYNYDLPHSKQSFVNNCGNNYVNNNYKDSAGYELPKSINSSVI